MKWYLFNKYVDDVNLYLESQKLGSRWVGGGGVGGKIVYKEEWKDQDISKGKSKGEVTMEIIKEMGESQSSFMKLTIDLEEKHIDKKVPMLDIAIIRVDKNDIRHEFYEKKVASQRVILNQSAMNQQSKVSSLSQEIVRRMSNTGRNVKIERRIDILNVFMLKLRRSGYCEKVREEILKCGLAGYYKKVEREIKGERKSIETVERIEPSKRSTNWLKVMNGTSPKSQWMKVVLKVGVRKEREWEIIVK